jgi:hypothetical protein
MKSASRPTFNKVKINYVIIIYLRSGALLEKLSIVQPLRNFPAVYGTQKFIAVFTRALHWSLF